MSRENRGFPALILGIRSWRKNEHR